MDKDAHIRDLYLAGECEKAFSMLVAQYSEQLYWHIRTMVASHEDTNDILQMTLIKAWNNLPGFRWESSLYTWMYRIATNESLNFLKAAEARAHFSMTDYENVLSARLEADPYFNGNDLQKKLCKLVLALPAKQRAVFSMRYFKQMSYEQIASITDTSVGALKASYHHAYLKIKEALETND